MRQQHTQQQGQGTQPVCQQHCLQLERRSIHHGRRLRGAKLLQHTEQPLRQRTLWRRQWLQRRQLQLPLLRQGQHPRQRSRRQAQSCCHHQLCRFRRCCYPLFLSFPRHLSSLCHHSPTQRDGRILPCPRLRRLLHDRRVHELWSAGSVHLQRSQPALWHTIVVEGVEGRASRRHRQGRHTRHVGDHPWHRPSQRRRHGDRGERLCQYRVIPQQPPYSPYRPHLPPPAHARGADLDHHYHNANILARLDRARGRILRRSKDRRRRICRGIPCRSQCHVPAPCQSRTRHSLYHTRQSLWHQRCRPDRLFRL